MKKTTISQLAKEVAVTNRTVIETANRLGIKAKSASKVLSWEDARRIRLEFAIPNKLRVPRKEAIRKLQQQINQGTRITNLSMSTVGSLNNVLSRTSTWAENNYRTLELLFGDSQLAYTYDLRRSEEFYPDPDIPKWVLAEMSADLRHAINDDVQSLEAIVYRLQAFAPVGRVATRAIELDLKNFSKEHDAKKTVFIMMKFPGKGDDFEKSKKLKTLFRTIKSELDKYGLQAIRADEKNYASSGFLWDNVQVYLRGSKYGIAILENLYAKETNPNVTLEYGYMLALDKRVLLLKQSSFRSLQADLLGKLWKEFEFADANSIRQAIQEWMVDLHITRIKA